MLLCLCSSYQALPSLTLYVVFLPLCPSFATQISFQVWTDQIQETIKSKKQGDSAFHARDFSKAIECYTQVSQLEIRGA